jgi:hypothetical protein
MQLLLSFFLLGSLSAPVRAQNKMMIKTMCGSLQAEMVPNNMPEYVSGIRFNACIQAGAYSLPQTRAVLYEADLACTSFVIKYYNGTECSSEHLIRTDPPQALDESICFNDQYTFKCGTIDDVSVDAFSGIMQYGYEDSICGTLDYFMQYGCETDASTCLNLEPFGAPDSARVLCSAGNGSTIHYGSSFTCDTEPIISSRPVETCVPFVEGIDDQFSQGNIYFTRTTMRQVLCSQTSKDNDGDDESKGVSEVALALIITSSVLFFFVCVWRLLSLYRRHTTNADKGTISEIENPVMN